MRLHRRRDDVVGGVERDGGEDGVDEDAEALSARTGRAIGGGALDVGGASDLREVVGPFALGHGGHDDARARALIDRIFPRILPLGVET